MKRAFKGSLALLSFIVFTGYTSSASAQPATNKPSDQKETVLKLANVNPKDSPVGQGADKFAELVAKGTNGKVKVVVFHGGTLGGERQALDSMKFGAIEMTIVGDIVFPAFAPRYTGLSTPYLFRNVEHLHKVLQGDIGNEINEEINKNANSTVLDWWDRSPRNLTARKEIKIPEDLAGLKLRTPEIPIFLDSWKALGATPTPMSFTELYTALEQKVIDGQENPVDLIYTNKFNEVQSHLMMTEHLFGSYVMLINTKKLKSFSPDVQKAIKDAALEAGKYARDINKKSEQGYFKKLQEAGMKIVEVDKSLFAKKLEAANVEEKYIDKWAPNLLKRVRDVK